MSSPRRPRPRPLALALIGAALAAAPALDASAAAAALDVSAPVVASADASATRERSANGTGSGKRGAAASRAKGAAKRSAAKRAAARKAAAKKAATRKTAARKATAARRTAAKKATARAGARSASARRSAARRASAARTAKRTSAVRGARRTADRLPPLAFVSAEAEAAGATLRGSPSSVDNAYRAATSAGLAFTVSRAEILRGAEEGAYVHLGGGDVRLKGVTVPYGRPATRAFVHRFAARYRERCGEPMTVTSGMRPTTMHLPNSVEKSVHPTGMAVDLRIPRGGCRNWMRRELLEQEAAGVIDVTEERRPAHFHVVVFRAP